MLREPQGIGAQRRLVVYPGSESYPAQDGVEVLPLREAIAAVLGS
jgi:hypothetical protein